MARLAYWTILIGTSPTAFRAKEPNDLVPTLKQLQRVHPDAVMKWFQRGRVWDSPADAEAVRRSSHSGRERRPADWRPGGAHKDPRQRFKDAKKQKWAAFRQERFDRQTRRERPAGDERPRFERPRDERPRDTRPRDERPRDERPREERPRTDRPRSGWPRANRPREQRPGGDRPRDERPRNDRPRSDRPRGERPRGDGPREQRWTRPAGPPSSRPPRPRTDGDKRPHSGGGGRAPRNDRRDRDDRASGTARPPRPPRPPSSGRRPSSDETPRKRRDDD